MEEVKRIGTKPGGHVPGKVHIYVATPAYNGMVHDLYSQSMVEAAFCCPLYQVYLTSAVMRGGAFIDLARNLYVHWFLTHEELKECTHLFFIDGDLGFEARGFIGLAKAGLPICAGAYRRRQDDEDYPIVRAEHPDKSGLWVETDANGGEWIMADRAATGFMCISRKVLEEMAAEAPKIVIKGQGEVAKLFYTYINEKNEYMGEDFTFCDNYRKKYGQPIWVWPDMDFSHDGYEGNYKAWLVKKIAENPDNVKLDIQTVEHGMAEPKTGKTSTAA